MKNTIILGFSCLMLAQAAQAQNIFQRISGSEDPNLETTLEAQPVPAPEPIPSLSEIVRGEMSDYPALQWQELYSDKSECQNRLQLYYDQALLSQTYVIPQANNWLELYPEDGRQIYICDGALLNYYFDKNNNVPSRWMMVRNSLDYILAN